MKKWNLILVLLLLLSSCQKNENGGTTTGNPITINLKVTGSSLTSNVVKNIQPRRFWPSFFFPHVYALTPPSMVDSGGRTVTLTSMWIVLKSIEFKSTEVSGGTESSEVKFTGPFAIDLLDNAPVSLGQATIVPPIRRFKAVLHKMDFTPPTGAPAGLTNYAIYIEGSVNGNNFTMRSDEGVEYEVGGPNGVSPNPNAIMLLSVHTANLFKRMDLSNVTNGMIIDGTNKVPTTSPCPGINASASELYTCFKDGLKSEANFGEDKASDDELDGADDTVK